jgi:hypothetical protein
MQGSSHHEWVKMEKDPLMGEKRERNKNAKLFLLKYMQKKVLLDDFLLKFLWLSCEIQIY